MEMSGAIIVVILHCVNYVRSVPIKPMRASYSPNTHSTGQSVIAGT
jgi:hypothetical protein